MYVYDFLFVYSLAVISLVGLGLVGMCLHRQNLIRFFLCMELCFAGCILLVGGTVSLYNGDVFGLVLGLFLLSLAGVESALGLCFLVVFYRVLADVNIYLLDRRSLR